MSIQVGIVLQEETTPLYCIESIIRYRRLGTVIMIINAWLNHFIRCVNPVYDIHISSKVTDLEILRGGFSLSPIWVEDKKNVFTSFLSHFWLTETSSATSTTPTPTHWPYFKVIFALHGTCYQSSLIRGVHSFRGYFNWNHCNPSVSATVLSPVIIDKSRFCVSHAPLYVPLQCCTPYIEAYSFSYGHFTITE